MKQCRAFDRTVYGFGSENTKVTIFLRPQSGTGATVGGGLH